jgi:hypothetical protein
MAPFPWGEFVSSIYAWVILGVVLSARRVPVSLGSRLDDLAYSMIAASRHLPPMSRYNARLGAPFLGKAVCLHCADKWRFYSPIGVDPEIEMTCPRGHEAGRVI